MNGEPAVRVLTMVPVYHLPKELEGPFESGRVRRGPERPVLPPRMVIISMMGRAVHRGTRGW